MTGLDADGDLTDTQKRKGLADNCRRLYKLK